MKYQIILSSEANKDYAEYINTIMYDYNAPLTAAKHYMGLYSTLKSLETYPEIFQIQTRRSLSQYGTNVRRINYKKMAIIYTIHGDIVYIHRIIPASMITGL